MAANPLAVSPSPPASWLDTDLFGRLSLPLHLIGNADTDAIVARARELARGSKAAETRRSYRTSWTQWCAFCERLGYEPLGGDVRAVGLFMADLSRTKSLATVRTRLAAVSTAHRIAGVPLDTRAAPIATVVEGFKREHGIRPLRQATPLLLDVLPRFLAAYETPMPANRRDKALLLAGFASALRRSELVALDVADLEFTDKGLVIHLRRSKMDQHGKGEMIAIHKGANTALCPVTALENWLALRTSAPGPLFTRLHKGGRVTFIRLRPQAVSLIVKRAVEAIGFDPQTFSGHSLRAGLATSAALAGADLHQIMTQTRHRSTDVARRYIRHAEVWRDNVTRLLFCADQSQE
jgi:integrase